MRTPLLPVAGGHTTRAPTPSSWLLVWSPMPSQPESLVEVHHSIIQASLSLHNTPPKNRPHIPSHIAGTPWHPIVGGSCCILRAHRRRKLSPRPHRPTLGMQLGGASRPAGVWNFHKQAKYPDREVVIMHFLGWGIGSCWAHPTYTPP